MNRIVAAVLLALTALPVRGQLIVPTTPPRPIQDATMVFMDRGSQLEILPTARAVPQGSKAGVVHHHVEQATAGTPVSNKQLGVVFNHAMQQTGFFTGEIAFKPKVGVDARSIVEQGLRPKQLGKTEIYVVRATTPGQFKSVLKGLQDRTTLEWVEPTIIYGALD